MSHRSLLRARACAAFAAVLVAFPVSGCSDGDHTVQVQPPFSSSQLDDANYQDVVAQFQEAGFTNVTTEPRPPMAKLKRSQLPAIPNSKVASISIPLWL